MTHIDNMISKVTVFRDGARITRVGRVKLSAGPQKIQIPDITSLAREDSFRVKGRGPAALSGIDVRRIEKVFEPDEGTRDLVEQLRGLERRLAAINDELAIYQKRRDYLNLMLEEFGSAYGKAFAEDLVDASYLEKIDAKSTTLLEQTDDKMHELQREAEQVTTEIEVIRQNLGLISSKRRTEVTFEVEVSLEVREESEIELEISYQCEGASWTPSYDVDLQIGKAILRRVALVRNQTKEDWDDVDLTISSATARPVEAIEGSPFFISEFIPRPAPKRDRRSMMKKLAPAAMPPPSPAPGEMPSEPAPPPEMEEVFADVTESASGIAVYEIPKRISIPFDNERHPVTLIEEHLETRTLHYWYADAMPDVVAQDEVTNGDSVILPGKAKVYAEGDYIGETSFDIIAPREKFKLGTRIAYDVKAKKELIAKEIEKAGITRGKLRRSYRYRIEIQNFSKREILIEIVDRIPHSNSPSIEVQFDNEKYGLVKYNLGVMHWEKAIEANGKIEISYAFEVSWERGITITPPLP